MNPFTPPQNCPSNNRRHHRHKKFHVRPEAVGCGYESFSAPLAPPAATPPISRVEPPTAGPDTCSEKAIARLAARKGIRISLTLLACVGALVLAQAQFDSFKTLGRWLLSMMPQPIVTSGTAARMPH